MENEKVILYIPYSEKDGAKLLGAKWDMEGKYWYSTREKIEGTDLEKYLVEPEKIYYRIQFNQKERAKQLGAKWDAKCAMWYGMSNNIELFQIFRMYADVPKDYKNPHIVRPRKELKEEVAKTIPYFDALRDTNLYL
jgi:hypothetical protein